MSDYPKFSIVTIARNEVHTVPRFAGSIREFLRRGGDWVLLDTGSTDGTPEIARGLGARVLEVGERFLNTLGQKSCDEINCRFVADGENPTVQAGDKLFCFADARNYAASLAGNDMVSMPDCDEVYTRLDIDAIDRKIEQGIEQMEFHFIFAHSPDGQPSVKFIQCKMYDRRKMHWVGIVHEVLQGEAKRELLPEEVLLLEHFQEPKGHRASYLPGLALDCFEHPDNDRNSHYLGRELLWTGRPKSAIKELLRHVEMNCWAAERAQSMVFLGDAHGAIGDPGSQREWYQRAFDTDPTRREALIRLAQFYRHHHKPEACAAYAAAALQIPWHEFYANNLEHYRHVPHELLSWARGWMGDIAGAREHLLQALAFQPHNPAYLDYTKYYFPYSDQGIEGWMRYPELQWLHETAGRMESVCEVGSWKGRSTHAIASGCKGAVTAVDHFQGSIGEEAQHQEAKVDPDAIYRQFLANTQGLKNLSVARKPSLEAAKDFPDRAFDMVFIDAGHGYEDARADIRAWEPKAKLLLCGHDYSDQWPGVRRAVEEELGQVGVCDSIWYKWLQEPMVSIIIPTLGRPESLHRCLDAIRKNAGYSRYEVIVLPDQGPPNNLGVPVLLAMGVERSKGELVMYLSNDCEPESGFLQEAVWAMARAFPEMDGLVALNDGYWHGEFATHWLASKKLLPMLGGEFFHLGYRHSGCDNELTERCRQAGKYVWCEKSKVGHRHPGTDAATGDWVHKLAYDPERRRQDLELLEKRSREIGFPLRRDFARPRIPRKLFTVWLGGQMPELVQRCIQTQKLPGWEHRVLGLKDCDEIPNDYLRQALVAKKWVKAADWLRMHWLHEYGGIYLDADVELLKPFPDEMLTDRLFAGREHNGFIGNQILGSEAGHPLIGRILEHVEANFRGDDDLNFESSIAVLTAQAQKAQEEDLGVRIYPPDWFFPYDHQRGVTEVTGNSVALHYFMKSWVPERKPLTAQQAAEIGYWRSVRVGLPDVLAFFTERRKHFGEQSRRFSEILSQRGIGLDLACGPGSVFQYHPEINNGLSVLAVDTILEEYRRSELLPPGPLVEYREMDGEKLDFPDGHFDFVWCYNALDHTPNPERMLAEVRRVLKPGGTFYLLVYLDPHLFPAHHQLWDLCKVQEYLKGFRVVRGDMFDYPLHGGWGWAGVYR